MAAQGGAFRPQTAVSKTRHFAPPMPFRLAHARPGEGAASVGNASHRCVNPGATAAATDDEVQFDTLRCSIVEHVRTTSLPIEHGELLGFRVILPRADTTSTYVAAEIGGEARIPD